MENRILKILAIDDNPDNLLTVQALVSEAFPAARVLKASNGMRGIELASAENPDVILLDILMPEMDGYEVCRILKSDKALMDIPVVFVTSLKSDKDMRIRGLEVGADAFLSKPIDSSELVAQIRAMVKIKDLNAKRYDENIRLAALVEERTRELKRTHSATLNLLEDLRNEIEVRKSTEKALRESEALYRAILEASPDNIIISDTKGQIEMVSPSSLQRYGLESEEQVVGKNVVDFFSDDDRFKALGDIRALGRGKNSGPNEYKSFNANGNVIDIEVNGGMMRDAQGKVSKLVLIARDITERKHIQELLEKSEAKYREFVENSPEAIAIYADGIVNYVNRECLRLMKAKTKEELQGKPVEGFFHPDRRAGALERMQHTGNNDVDNALPAVEEKFIRLDGAPIDVEMKVMPLLLDGAPAVQLTARDISDRKQVEKALEESRIELKTIYDYAPVMMCVIDADRRIQFANKAFTALTGLTEAMLKGGDMGSVIGCIKSVDLPNGCGKKSTCKNCSLRKALENTYTTGKGHQNIEFQTVMTNGTTTRDVYLLGSTALIPTPEKKSILLCFHDITDRKLAEEALQKSETLLRTFIDNSPFEIWARDTESVGILENKKLVRHYGSIIGSTPKTDRRIDQQIAMNWEKLNKRVFNGETIDEEYDFRVNNEIRSFQQIVFPIKNSNKIIGIAGFNIDITERKRAEEKLHEYNERLELSMQVSNSAWWEMNVPTGSMVFGKRKADMLGFNARNFGYFKDFAELIHPGDYEKCISALRDHLEGKVDKFEVEYRVLTSSGEYKWFYDVGSVSKRDDHDKPLIVSGLTIDISYRKEAEKELSNQKRFFEQMFMQSSLSTQILTKDGWCERINPRLSHIFGVKAGDMEGYVYNIFQDEEIKRKGIVPKLKRVFEQGKTSEWEVHLDIGMSTRSQNIQSKQAKKVWLSNWAYPILDEHGEISHVIIQHTDISHRKEAEKALSESQEQLKKFAAHLQNIREEERVMLAREIHDELGQILIAIKIDMGMLKQTVLKGIDDEYAEDVFVKFDKLVNLVNNTIKTARKIMTDLRPEVLELLGFNEAVKLYVKNFQERHHVACRFVNTVRYLDLDSQHSVALFRIIQEALNNVSKHARATLVSIDLSQANGKLILQITDNGVGFDENKKKNTDSYGLIGMKERVFLLDGELHISSKPGEGTKIRVEMPYKN